MKKILFIIAITFAHFFNLSAQKKALENLFDQYQDTEGVTSIKIAKPMFSLLSKLDIGDSDLDQIKPLLGKIQGLKILVIEDNANTKNGLTKLSTDILNNVNKLNYQELVTVNNKDAKIKFLSSEATDGMLENLLLNINSDSNTVLMMLDGKISIDDVNRLVEETQEQIDSKPNKKSSSNSRAKEERKVEAFDGINISNGIKVFYTQGSPQHLTVETDSDKIQYLKSEVKNGVLHLYIDTKGKKYTTLNNIIVEVSSPQLKTVNASSASQFIVNNTVTTDQLDVKISSAASITGNFKVENLSIESSSGARGTIATNSKNLTHKGSSASSLKITGKAEESNYFLSSAATTDAENLESKTVNIDASSASSIKVHVLNTLNTKGSSGASIRYKGNPNNVKNNDSSGATTKTL